MAKCNLYKSTASVLICAFLAASLCSCTGRDNFVEASRDYAIRLCDAIVARDSETVKKMAPDIEGNIDERYSLASEGSSSLDIEAREIVASTLSYSIDSVSCDKLGTSGHVNVKFTYTDYHPFVGNDVIFDIDSFREDMLSATGKIATTMTLTFKTGITGKLECTDLGTTGDIFEYWDRDFDGIGHLYVSPSDGIVSIPDTDITIELPSGYSCIPAASSDYCVRVVGQLGDEASDAVFFAVSDYNVITVWHLGDIPYNDTYGEEYIYRKLDDPSFFFELFAPYSDDPDISLTLSTRDYYSGGMSYTVYTQCLECDPEIVDIQEGLSDTWYRSYVLIGDEDSCYFLCVFTESPEVVDEVMNCIAP